MASFSPLEVTPGKLRYMVQFYEEVPAQLEALARSVATQVKENKGDGYLESLAEIRGMRSVDVFVGALQKELGAVRTPAARKLLAACSQTTLAAIAQPTSSPKRTQGVGQGGDSSASSIPPPKMEDLSGATYLESPSSVSTSSHESRPLPRRPDKPPPSRPKAPSPVSVSAPQEGKKTAAATAATAAPLQTEAQALLQAKNAVRHDLRAWANSHRRIVTAAVLDQVAQALVDMAGPALATKGLKPTDHGFEAQLLSSLQSDQLDGVKGDMIKKAGDQQLKEMGEVVRWTNVHKVRDSIHLDQSDALVDYPRETQQGVCAAASYLWLRRARRDGDKPLRETAQNVISEEAIALQQLYSSSQNVFASLMQGITQTSMPKDQLVADGLMEAAVALPPARKGHTAVGEQVAAVVQRVMQEGDSNRTFMIGLDGGEGKHAIGLQVVKGEKGWVVRMLDVNHVAAELDGRDCTKALADYFQTFYPSYDRLSMREYKSTR